MEVGNLAPKVSHPERLIRLQTRIGDQLVTNCSDLSLTRAVTDHRLI